MQRVPCPEFLTARRFPSAVRSSAPDPTVGDDIGAPYLPKINVRGIGGIAAVPPPCVDLSAWLEPPLVKPPRAKSGVGKTGNRLLPLDVRSTSPCDVTTYHLPLLCSAGMSSTDINAPLPCHMPCHHTRQLPCHSPYLMCAKNTSCWHQHTNAPKSAEMSKFC